jgi:3-deoxy-7-phosphoheptulonate synthase
MLIVMQKDASGDQIAAVNEKIVALGLTAHAIPGAQRVAIGITGNQSRIIGARPLFLPGRRPGCDPRQPAVQARFA